jgi:hypothetical protein
MFAILRVECRVERPLVVSERPVPPAYRLDGEEIEREVHRPLDVLRVQ